MRIFENKTFVKLAKSAGLSDDALKVAISEVQKNLVDAELGGNLVKKRIAVGGKGKSGGLRTILVYKASSEKVFCIYVFAKNEKGNISSTELAQLKLLAKTLLGLSEKGIKTALEAGELIEVAVDEAQEKTNAEREQSGKIGNKVSEGQRKKKTGKGSKHKKSKRQ